VVEDDADADNKKHLAHGRVETERKAREGSLRGAADVAVPVRENEGGTAKWQLVDADRDRLQIFPLLTRQNRRKGH
jgi:hypothetical protein